MIKKERNLHLLWHALVFQWFHWHLDLVIHFGGHCVQGFYKEHLVSICTVKTVYDSRKHYFYCNLSLNKEKVWMEAYTPDIHIGICVHVNIYYEKTLWF